MFDKKKCPSCGKKVKGEWEFCPFCGEELRERELFTPFGSLLEEVEKEFEKMDKIFKPLSLSSLKMKPVRSGGISIVIRSGSGMEPKVEIKTSGEYKKLEPELKRKFGLKPTVEEVEEEETKKVQRITEEAETEVKTVGNKQIISIKLPDVKSEEDINIKKLEQSLEVRAFGKDKAYFTLIPIQKNASITNKKFKNGVLEIEIER
ncbi:MAG: zinc ribbon domain-containing protein [Candidatus Aenigmatarchaeota archaeon]